MSIQKLTLAVALVLFSVPFAGAQPGTVKVTPLGSRTGDFCAQDRALLFEDPTGVRILYDPGDTVQGGQDSRLGWLGGPSMRSWLHMHTAITSGI
jgi:hypothetical protein